MLRSSWQRFYSIVFAANLTAIGRIEIPRLGVSVIVMEGANSNVMRHAAGHIAGTALPGQVGNVGISAHRDTFFRPLRNILTNDMILLTTTLGTFRYRVISTSVVAPADVAVLNSTSQQSLTLVTCYPFYFIGPAPNRFIVRAERIGYADSDPDSTSLRRPLAAAIE